MIGGPAIAGIAWQVLPGLAPYAATLEAMEARARAIRDQAAAEAVWLLEHPAVYTAGTSARQADLRAPGRLPVFRTGRGGQWTYHGPGQRVAYVMLDLSRPHGALPARDVRAFVAALETWLIAALARLGVRGERRAGRVGIWVETRRGEEKIAALGVRLSRWVSTHGVAINVCPDLADFAGIVPCGLELGVTSLAALGCAAGMAELDAALRQSWTLG